MISSLGLRGKEDCMGKSLKGKDLGVGITQRKDGTYQARFTDRSGKRRTLYNKNLSELRMMLRERKCQDEGQVQEVVEETTEDITVDMTLDEWFEMWRDTYKRNCRNTTMVSYTMIYKRLRQDLGWRKLSGLNLIIMQRCLNGLSTDQKRVDCKKILVDMLDKAVDSELLEKNVARKLNTTITREPKKERRVMTILETKLFLEAAKNTRYYDMYVLALETGMRMGEICGLMWGDIDFERRKLEVRRTMCYVYVDSKYVFDIHDTKSINGRRLIPLTAKAIQALERQFVRKNTIVLKGNKASEGFEDLVFVTGNNKPIELRAVRVCMEYVIRRIHKTHDFEWVTPHTFRHTFATRAIERGMNPKTLQKILGHSTLQMTMDLYCHVTDDTLFEEMRKFEKDCQYLG